jgi:hypothetical protein
MPAAVLAQVSDSQPEAAHGWGWGRSFWLVATIVMGLLLIGWTLRRGGRGGRSVL